MLTILIEDGKMKVKMRDKISRKLYQYTDSKFAETKYAFIRKNKKYLLGGVDNRFFNIRMNVKVALASGD
jgi:hypothetical protein